MSYARVYDFSIPANQTIYEEVPGNYYKIISSTGNVSVRRDNSNALFPLFAGRGEKGAVFQRLAITDLSGSTNTGSILIASDSEMVDTTLQLVGAVSVRPEGASGTFNDASAVVANTPFTIFTPAANTNGAILLSGEISWNDVAGQTNQQAFIAKASAPASINDGEILLRAGTTQYISAASVWGNAMLAKEQYIPAGKGLYFISAYGEAATITGQRSCRWKTL